MFADMTGFDVAIDDFAEDIAGEQAVLDLQRVGVNVVDVEPALHLFGKVGEAAGYKYSLYAVLTCHLHELLCAWIGAQTLGEYIIQ